VLKGVSGGEKRRVTLGEMLVTGAQIMCADEISTGVDSAATFDITKFLGSACHVMGQSILVALLQPAPEVLNLFDDSIVLAEGKIIYHGPKVKVQEYFEGLGFRVPASKYLADRQVFELLPVRPSQGAPRGVLDHDCRHCAGCGHCRLLLRHLVRLGLCAL
jgi:ABC-type multidrug transport system ATPase subunit